MKKILFVVLACLAFNVTQAQETTEPTEQSAEQEASATGITLGVAVSLNDITDKPAVGVHNEAVFDKTLRGLHLYSKIYDEVLYHDQMDMRTTHFEEEIGYRFSITQTMGIDFFVNNLNNLNSPQATQGTSSIDGSAESGLNLDGIFPFGHLQAGLGVPVLYRQYGEVPDIDPIVALHPEISWQSNFGLGFYGGISFAFPPGSNKELMTNSLPFERTEWKITYMTKSFYVELYLYTTIDFKEMNISPTIMYFSGPFSVWFNLDMGKIKYQTEFGVNPTAGITYSF